MLKIALLGSDAALLQLADMLRDALIALHKPVLIQVIGAAHARQANLASYDLVLLMGGEDAVESSVPRSGAQRPTLIPEESAHFSIRSVLADTALAYGVLYGTAEQRLACAIQAIDRLRPMPQARHSQNNASSDKKSKPWLGMCDKCSDPQCELRIFTALVTQRTRAV